MEKLRVNTRYIRQNSQTTYTVLYSESFVCMQGEIFLPALNWLEFLGEGCALQPPESTVRRYFMFRDQIDPYLFWTNSFAV